jgi:hypothetical protein
MATTERLALTRQPPDDWATPEPHHDKTRDGDQNAERKTPSHRDTSLQGLARQQQEHAANQEQK